MAVAAAAAFGLVFLAGVYLISDEKGLPVPTTFAGGKCWLTTRGIDVLDCREQGRGFYVGWMGRWQRTWRCLEVDRGVFRCELPYALRIDLTGDYPQSHRRLATVEEPSSNGAGRQGRTPRTLPTTRPHRTYETSEPRR